MKKMMRIIVAGSIACLFLACNDWLDVSPKSQVKNDDLFEDESGFQTALIGVYTAMGQRELYGENLTMGFLDVLAQYYDVKDGRHNYFDAYAYSYPASSVKSRISTIWKGMYRVIMNINNLLENMDAHSGVFTYQNEALIRGEALGLRAYLHFDLLRMFAPSYAVGAKEPAIPYVDKVVRTPFPQLRNEEVIEKILADCEKALECLKSSDPWGPAGDAVMRNDEFLNYRNERMNYYAVMALMARVYMWTGNTEKAKEYSGALIEARKVGAAAPIFSLYTDKVTTYSDEFFNDELESNVILTVFQKQRDDFYEVDKYGSYDNRISYGLRLIKGGIESEDKDKPTGVYVVTKYAKITITPESIPLLRMNEVRYIHAECVGGEEALADLNAVRQYYGIPTVMDLTLENCIVEEEVAKEYRKSFLAEGQFFYFMKRKDWTSIPYAPASVESPRKVYCFPLPDGELEFGNLIK